MIPVCTPLLGSQEKRYVADCIKSGWISSVGKYIDKFEAAFSQYCGANFGITTTSGTAALHLAIAALGLKEGDEVIMPSFTIASTAFAVIYCGGKPVFIDSEPETWNIDVEKIKEKITRKTKAIIPVHIYGHPCDMVPIMKLAKKYRMFVIEDAAEAHGAEYKKVKVGAIGDMGCFSFYSNKIITCGEGGMVVTNNKKLAQRCQLLKNLAFLKKKRFYHEDIGFNYRMTNAQAALGLAQFEKIEKLLAKRRRNAFAYHALLSKIPGLTLPVEKPWAKNVHWMYGLLVGKEFAVSRDILMQKLFKNGIETRTFFIPMHQQPILRKMKLTDNGRYPVADDISKRGLYLPSGGGLSQSEIEYICDVIKRVGQGCL